MKLPYYKRGLVPELIVLGVQGTPVVICLSDYLNNFKRNVTQKNIFSNVSGARKRRHLPDPLISARGKKEVEKIVNNDHKSNKISVHKPSNPLSSYKNIRSENKRLKNRAPVKHQSVTFLNHNKKSDFKEGNPCNLKTRRYLPKRPTDHLCCNCNKTHMKSKSNVVPNSQCRKFKFDNLFLQYGKPVHVNAFLFSSFFLVYFFFER